MLSAAVSLVILLVGIGLAVCFLLRQMAAIRAETRESNRELEIRLATLQELILTARSEVQRLEAAVKSAQVLELDSTRDSLKSLENLADPSSLADPDALSHAAAQLPQLPSDVAGDVFDLDQKALAIARLKDQGNSPGEIAHRLGLPLGEVELRLSMRSV